MTDKKYTLGIDIGSTTVKIAIEVIEVTIEVIGFQAWMRHAQAMLFAIMAMWRCMTEKEKS